MAIMLKVTDAGRAALVNAVNTGTLPVLITQVGVTEQSFTAAGDGSDTTLPGELKSLTTFAGAAVAADTLHITIRDDSADTYSLRGFALYLDDGTLFALYGGADVLLEKSTQSTLLLAADNVFADIDATQLTVGDTDFMLPPATTTVQGVVELATPTEAKVGTDATRAVTPAGHKAAVDNRFGTGAPSGFVKGLLTLASAAAFRLALGIKGAALYATGTGNGLDADKLDGQHGAYYRAWGNLTGVPSSFAPSAHTHPWAQVTGKPSSFPPSAHTQAISTITGLATALDGKLPTSGPIIASGYLTLQPFDASYDDGSVLKIYYDGHHREMVVRGALQLSGTISASNIGTASAYSVEHFASAQQGAKADSALQPDYAVQEHARKAVELGAGENPDTHTTPGLYSQEQNSETNWSWPSQYAGLLEVGSSGSGLMTYQRYTEYSPHGRAFVRGLYAGTWSAWERVAYTSDLGTAAAKSASSFMPTSWTVAAGAGLTGGGNGTASRVLNMGPPQTITASSTNVAASGSHSHAINITAHDIGALDATDVGSAAAHATGDFLGATSPTVQRGYFSVGSYDSARDDGSAMESYYSGTDRTFTIRGRGSSGTLNCAIDLTGTMTATEFVSAGSSRAVKRDIVPIRYGLAEAMRLPWVEYRYDECITDDDRLRFGTAVEAGDGMEGVEDVTPLIVRQTVKGVPTVDYSEFVPVIGRALQEYVTRTDALVAALSERISALESRT